MASSYHLPIFFSFFSHSLLDWSELFMFWILSIRSLFLSKHFSLNLSLIFDTELLNLIFETELLSCNFGCKCVLILMWSNVRIFLLWLLDFLFCFVLLWVLQNFKALQRYPFYLIIIQSYRLLFLPLAFLYMWKVCFYEYSVMLAPSIQ